MLENKAVSTKKIRTYWKQKSGSKSFFVKIIFGVSFHSWPAEQQLVKMQFSSLCKFFPSYSVPNIELRKIALQIQLGIGKRENLVEKIGRVTAKFKLSHKRLIKIREKLPRIHKKVFCKKDCTFSPRCKNVTWPFQAWNFLCKLIPEFLSCFANYLAVFTIFSPWGEWKKGKTGERTRLLFSSFLLLLYGLQYLLLWGSFWGQSRNIIWGKFTP